MVDAVWVRKAIQLPAGALGQSIRHPHTYASGVIEQLSASTQTLLDNDITVASETENGTNANTNANTNPNIIHNESSPLPVFDVIALKRKRADSVATTPATNTPADVTDRVPMPGKWDSSDVMPATPATTSGTRRSKRTKKEKPDKAVKDEDAKDECLDHQARVVWFAWVWSLCA